MFSCLNSLHQLKSSNTKKFDLSLDLLLNSQQHNEDQKYYDLAHQTDKRVHLTKDQIC